MPEWHCRLAPSRGLAGEDCEGPRHSECGLRYEPGEYILTGQHLQLPEIGAVRIVGAAFVPEGAAVIVYRDGRGWVAEFEVMRLASGA